MGVSRRRVLMLAGGVLAALPARAQRIPRVGLVIAGSPQRADSRRFLHEFREGMRELRYQEGRSYRLDVRNYDNDRARIPAIVDGLIAAHCDVLVANLANTAAVMKSKTARIPIVMATAIDPVGEGLVASLGRPGGNVTGMTSFHPELHGRLVELAHNLLPKAKRFGFLVNPEHTLAKANEAGAGEAAIAHRVELVRLEMRRAADLERVSERLASGQADVLIVAADSLLFGLREAIVNEALRSGVPTVAPAAEFAARGALATYGSDPAGNFRGIARYVDKILKGAKPADLPIEGPTQFELVINMRTALALHITVPKDVLLRADRVVE